MDSKSELKPEITLKTKRFEEDEPSLGQHIGAFFPQAKDFVITGGRFESITHVHRTLPPFPDFREIPLGDLYLYHELGTVHRRYPGGPLRRIFSSGILGSNTRMTAILYEGESAEQQWREEVLRYSRLRHPNIAQLLGVVSSGLHGAVFHDDLIPYEEVLQKYKSSHFLTVDFWACMETEFRVRTVLFHSRTAHFTAGRGSIYGIFIQKTPGEGMAYARLLQLIIAQHWTDYTVWIRPSSRRLCLDLSTATSYVPLYLADVGPRQNRGSRRPQDSEIISSLSHQDYHSICYWHLCQFHQFFIPPEMPVRLGSVGRLADSKYDNSVEVGFLPELRLRDSGWNRADIFPDPMPWVVPNGTSVVLMDNGWIRVNSNQVGGLYRRRICAEPFYARSWLAHANHTFDSLDVTSNFDNYFLTDVIHYWLGFLGGRIPIPPGYLFLCPLDTLCADMPGGFRVPDCPAYWSFDRSGIQRLRSKDANRLGFPTIKVQIEVWGKFWDSSVYAGIAQFHKAQKFDARDLEAEYPRFHVDCGREAFSARGGARYCGNTAFLAGGTERSGA
ncbi:hypothetical protein B0H16DRAFT_99121 [Mycena metata]|uniref:Protein kinase domain-containing protein n=1 Tax=Mycena metata TaxID=1033252 RepID=A0AAD7I9H7_9AGAR|nr:hypothetical protein B0H16DRAFT_99121 [Mycena metata]